MKENRKNAWRRIVTAMALFVAVFLIRTTTAEAEEPAGYVVMSIEKLTLGQGFIMEPQEIPFYTGENLAQVTDRALREYASRDYLYTGNLSSNFYLSDIKDENRGNIENTMPAYIKKMADVLVKNNGLKPLQFEDTNDPEYLGEFDYFSQSGWMYSVQNVFPNVGAAGLAAADGQVVRWQFTLVGLGGDLGNSGMTIGESHPTMDKTDLMRTLAAIRNRQDLLDKENVRNAYEKCMTYAADMTAEEDAVAPFLDILKQAIGKNTITTLSLPDGAKASMETEFGTQETKIQAELPTWLKATVDGKNVNIVDVTWKCSNYQPKGPGEYIFVPVLPDAYTNYTLQCDLPQIKVTVKGVQGDVNGDGKATLQDISYMAASMGKSDRTDCDLNKDGVVNIKDFLLLKQILFTKNEAGEKTEEEAETGNGKIEAVFDKERYEANETAVVSVKIKQAKFDTFALNFRFDASEMEYRGLEITEGITPVENAVQEDGSLLCSGSSLNGVFDGETGDGIQIVSLRFTVLKAGKPDLKFVPSLLPAMEEKSYALLANGVYVQTTAYVKSPSGSESGEKTGDVNGDGEINLSDAILLLNKVTQGEEIDPMVGDVNADGKVNLQDAIKLLNLVTEG